MNLPLLAPLAWLACAARAPAPTPVPPADPLAAEAALLALPAPPDVEPAAAPAAAPPAAEDDHQVQTALDALDASLDAHLRSWQARDRSDAAQVAPLLADMVSVDQGLRHALDVTPDETWGLEERLAWVEGVEARIAEADRAHAEVVEDLLQRHGWFDIGRFGAVADQDGWILVQHASHDPELQARVLELLADRVAAGQSEPSRYAYLYDRVQALAGRPQRYGTQGRCTEDGAWEPLPLDQPERVDRWRAEVGLGTLDAYKAAIVDLCR